MSAARHNTWIRVLLFAEDALRPAKAALGTAQALFCPQPGFSSKLAR